MIRAMRQEEHLTGGFEVNCWGKANVVQGMRRGDCGNKDSR